MTQQDLYSKLWRIADHILKENNPCQILKDAEGKVSCIRFRHPKRRSDYDHVGQLCCLGCKHLGPNGCQVQSLSCKLGACHTFPGQFPMYVPHASDVNVAMEMLAHAAQLGGLKLWRNGRQSKTEYFQLMEAR